MDESVADCGGGPLPAPAAIDWVLVQADYESGPETIEAVAQKHGISRSQLLWRARTNLWRSRNRKKASGGPALLLRLFRLLERQIFQLENETSPMGEKEAAVLGRVAATLEKLIEIERASAPPKPARRQSKDLEELRKKVAARFEELSQR